ncbi:glycerol kinase GlpK [Alteraurantiacibacter aestuarii]|uniref:Glycerol kinase GlpK n=1 Tax=Alteraurantiacibacter aestuarii TaxID=650004 RepID=A0A844ZMP3_9SPHN|nr:glycerol kinase GlpK [Alteraurantiacibacter aestuarii]MXO88804.1 glycerol kinase GlpK [Alteraurantiacibacter aestuarii]
MTDRLILVLDEGTTSTRAMLFGADGAQHGVAQADLTQHYPRSGWVEHDAGEIWDRTLACAREMVAKAGGADRIAAIGITNQRETVVAWDRQTGEPYARAIVWQDRRTASMCEAMREAALEDAIRAQTGLLLDPYFSATKMRWLLDNEPAVAAAAQAGTLALGTVESWLTYKLTGGSKGGRHISDASNASRTLLLALDGAGFDEGLCDAFGVPRSALPDVVDNAGQLGVTAPGLLGGAIPICGMAGDQQAATIGQGCLSPGDTKATYGTGAFVLANKGRDIPQSANRLLGTVLYQIGGERHYALEGSVFVAGSLIKYLRDTLGLISSAAETEELARSVEDNGGVVVVPALSGLGAPHWLPDARATITGLSFSAGKAHIARAALEAMAHQTRDLAQAFAADGAPWSRLRVDGGMSANSWMVQDIANLLDLPVERPHLVETTALGAAMLAAVGAGIHPALDQAAAAMIGESSRFAPQMHGPDRQKRLGDWAEAIARM